jgi:diaminopimelate epimerase
MKLDIVRADPAGNITIFVLNQTGDPGLRARIAKALLAEPSLKAEQVGFVIPPARGEDRLWRLEMMGAEFCGNAARSFGLYAGREEGLAGKRDIRIGISGVPRPVLVRADLDASAAEVEIPPPAASGAVSWGGRSFPVYFFEGITQVIAQGLDPSRDLVFSLMELVRNMDGALDDRSLARARHPMEAFGVAFYDPGRCFMRPAVYVAATESLVFESSCGSGTAALAAWLSRDLESGEESRTIAQPGGLIAGRVKKEAGEIKALSIGGPVILEGRRSLTL